MPQEIDRLRATIERLHNCNAAHAHSVWVRENSTGGTVWEGEVEVFMLTNHPSAIRCYAWVAKGEIVASLEQPPIECAASAVRAFVRS